MQAGRQARRQAGLGLGLPGSLFLVLASSYTVCECPATQNFILLPSCRAGECLDPAAVAHAKARKAAAKSAGSAAARMQAPAGLGRSTASCRGPDAHDGSTGISAAPSTVLSNSACRHGSENQGHQQRASVVDRADETGVTSIRCRLLPQPMSSLSDRQTPWSEPAALQRDSLAGSRMEGWLGKVLPEGPLAENKELVNAAGGEEGGIGAEDEQKGSPGSERVNNVPVPRNLPYHSLTPKEGIGDERGKGEVPGWRGVQEPATASGGKGEAYRQLQNEMRGNEKGMGVALAPEGVSEREMVIAGYKAQSEMVMDGLDRLLMQWEGQGESAVVEGVHLSLNFVVRRTLSVGKAKENT